MVTCRLIALENGPVIALYLDSIIFEAVMAVRVTGTLSEVIASETETAFIALATDEHN